MHTYLRTLSTDSNKTCDFMVNKKGWGVVILLRDSLKCEIHLRFQADSFENNQLTLVSGE